MSLDETSWMLSSGLVVVSGTFASMESMFLNFTGVWVGVTDDNDALLTRGGRLMRAARKY